VTGARHLPILTEDDALDFVRPKRREDCAAAIRPCPWGGCEFNLAVDIRQRKVRILLGHYVRASHETCIIAARPGAASTILRHDIPSVLFAPLGRHSEKPAAFYKLVEALAPGPYLELFGRAPRKGWTVIGDALGARLELPLVGAAR
jgi:hypothetical protein